MNLRALLLASTIAFTSLPAAAQTPVDVELVLAIDASGSVDEAEHQLQRDGYIRALTSKRIVQTIQRGAHGRIALTAFEWSAQGEQQTILPWVVVETPKHAAIAASFFQRAPRLLERRPVPAERP